MHGNTFYSRIGPYFAPIPEQMTKSSGNKLPICFTREEARRQLGGTLVALDSWIKRALKRDELVLVKKGLYMSSHTYLHETDKTKLTELLAGQLCQPSYISLEYVLEKHNLLSRPSTPTAITSITTKSGRTFTNISGTFRYASIKPSLFLGFHEESLRDMSYRVATKTKALYDYLYLNSALARRNARQLKHQLFKELPIQWNNFTEKDFKEFDRYVWKSNSKKMISIWSILKSHFDKKKMDRDFEVFRKELLG